jgi:uncharacterized oxidoreductase
MKTSGNTVLITGGGSGIGLALADALARRDNEVIVCGRRRQRLLAAKKSHRNIHVRVCDLSVPRSRRALVDWLLSGFKDLNLVVNNAGIQRSVDFLQGPRDLADADEEIATNLAAPIHLSALLIPHLRRQKAAAIVNISSGLAFTPMAVVPVYCATKAALHSLSVSLRYQLRGTTVRVLEVAPPMVATELAGSRRRPESHDQAMSAETVAAGIIEALEQDEQEVALGAAHNLREQREALFTAINS